MYVPQRLIGRLLKWAGRQGLWRGARVDLDRRELALLEDCIAAVLGEEDLRLAFSLGTPGAYRKHTLQVMAPDGSVLAYAKAAEAPRAQAALRDEQRNLEVLAAAPALKGTLPTLYGAFTCRDTFGILLSPGPQPTGPSDFGPAQIAFLNRLYEATRTPPRLFTQSVLWQCAQTDWADLHERLPASWRTRYQHALRWLEQYFAGVRLPLCYAHRDFAPWNTRFDGEKLFVFDWEAARGGYPPLYDAFHFEAIQVALGLKADAHWAEFDGTDLACWADVQPWAAGLKLAYLVDMSLYYSRARIEAPEDGDSSVWLWLGQQIDTLLHS